MCKLVSSTLVILTVFAKMVLAHAVLVEAVPSARASIAGPEVKIRLRFNSRIDAARSTLKLVLPDGKVLSLPIGQQPSPDSITAKSEGMVSGSYTLRWQVLSQDGHITRGEVPFEVR